MRSCKVQWIGERPLIRKRKDAAVKTLKHCGGKHGTSRKGNPAEGPRGKHRPGPLWNNAQVMDGRMCRGEGCSLTSPWVDECRRPLMDEVFTEHQEKCKSGLLLLRLMKWIYSGVEWFNAPKEEFNYFPSALETLHRGIVICLFISYQNWI